MLKKFLLVTLLTNSVYLGYQKQFSNALMFSNLLGSRAGLDLHNLFITLNNFKKLFNIATLA